jgi:hypothetical protein
LGYEPNELPTAPPRAIYRDQYFNNINKIIAGEKPDDFMNDFEIQADENPAFARSLADSILRHDVDLAEKLSLPNVNEQQSSLKLDKLHFFFSCARHGYQLF